MPVQRPYNHNPRRMAELMQADLADAGIKIEIVREPRSWRGDITFPGNITT
jgi:ABC-type transport system substrate-binding protein